MTQIKLKAWDPIDKKMGEVETYYPKTGKVMFENDKWDWYKRDRIVLRPTGLKDKNGKEIYEGDIIQEPDYSGGVVLVGGSQPKRRYVVEYTIENSIGKKAGYNLKVGFENGFYKGEVIGNIYENPELLEVIA